MEPIKEALARARKEREERAGHRLEQYAAAQRERRAARERPALAAVAQGPVNYVHTRTVQVAPRVLHAHRVISNDSNDPISDAYKVLRTQVLLRLRDRGWKSLAVTSPAPEQGKTLTAVNLAISIAREVNHTVLLVDLDLRRPKIHKMFGVEPAVGLTDFLQRDDLTVSDILFHPEGLNDLVVMPAGPPMTHSSEMLSSPRMVELIRDLSTRYPSRIVIVDLPPVLVTDDALAFVPQIDAVLLVVSERESRRDEVSESLDLLKDANLIGTVLNNAEQSEAGYYY